MCNELFGHHSTTGGVWPGRSATVKPKFPKVEILQDYFFGVQKQLVTKYQTSIWIPPHLHVLLYKNQCTVSLRTLFKKRLSQ